MFGAETPFLFLGAEVALADAVELEGAEEGDAEGEGDAVVPHGFGAAPGGRGSGGEGFFAVVGRPVEGAELLLGVLGSSGEGKGVAVEGGCYAAEGLSSGHDVCVFMSSRVFYCPL